MRFADIIGHDNLKRMLAGGAAHGRISHAQLYTGRAGYGALPLALAYAQFLNCTDRRGEDSCGECPSCIKMGQLAHPDLHFAFPVNSPKGSKGAKKPLSDSFMAEFRDMCMQTGGYFDEQQWYSSIDIDNQQGIISRAETDEIMRKLSFKSFEGRYKIMVIWLPERMRSEGANALLKLLEEPWERTVFLLVSQTPQALLATVLSRTQQISVPGIDTGDLETYLAAKYGMDAGQAAHIARISMGDLIEARRMASGGENDAAPHFDMFMQLMRMSYNDRHMELLEWGDNVAAMGREEQKELLRYSVRMLRESYMLNAGMDDISYLSGAELAFGRNFSPFIGNHNIEMLTAHLEEAIAQVSQNGNPRIIFPHLALQVSKLIVK